MSSQRVIGTARVRVAARLAGNSAWFLSGAAGDVIGAPCTEPGADRRARPGRVDRDPRPANEDEGAPHPPPTR